MSNYPEKYNKIFKLTETENFQENFRVSFFKTKLSVKIRQARLEQGLSQTELKNKAKTTQRIISAIENGNYNVGIDLLYRIFKVLKLRFVLNGEDLTSEGQVLGASYTKFKNYKEEKFNN